MKLSIKQTQALDYLEDKVTNEIIYGGGAGGGKSILGCYWVLKQCLKYPGTRWLVGRSKAKTLKETTLNSLFEVCKMQGMKADVDFIYNQQAGVIKFNNGSEILLKDLFLYPADPDFDELGSLEISGAFIDECNQIVEKAWNIVKSRIRYKLDEYGIVPKILGTCNPSQGYVYYNFYKPYRDNILDSNKAFIESLVDDNPFISQYYKGNLMTLDEKSKQRLLFGNWDYLDSEKNLFSYASLVDVFSNTIDKGTDRYLIVDIADDGTDQTIFSFWEGLEEYHREEFDHLNTEGIIQKIRQYASDEKIPYSHIAVDAIGVGAGVASSSLLDGIIGFKSSYAPIKTDDNIIQLPNVNYTKTASLVSDFKNLRSQCIFTLSDKVNRHLIASKVQGRQKEVIIEELSVYQDTTKNDGKRQATGKEEVKGIIGRSPDASDCFIAGTKVFTLNGEKNIEDIKTGDAVVTPFGYATVQDTIKKKANILYTLDNKLTGTGNHKIFSGSGFSTLDTYNMIVYNYYTYTNYNKYIWKILSSLSTKIKNTGFRVLVNTSTFARTKTELDKEELHYIDKFGKTTTKRSYLRNTTYIILTGILLITTRLIWSALKALNTIKCTVKRSLKKNQRYFYGILIKLGLKQVNGTRVMMGENGTQVCQKNLGSIKSQKISLVKIVAMFFRDLTRLVSVQIVACKNTITELKNITKIENVSFVEMLLVSGSLNRPNVAQEVVRQSLDGKVDVYTLSLDKHHVYIANGVLVANCWIMRQYFEVMSKINPDQSEAKALIHNKLKEQFAKRNREFANNSTR